MLVAHQAFPLPEGTVSTAYCKEFSLLIPWGSWLHGLRLQPLNNPPRMLGQCFYAWLEGIIIYSHCSLLCGCWESGLAMPVLILNEYTPWQVMWLK